MYSYKVCRKYLQLIYRSIKNPILNTTNRVKDCVDTKTLIIDVNRTKADLKQFTHVVIINIKNNDLLGIGETWRCAYVQVTHQ